MMLVQAYKLESWRIFNNELEYILHFIRENLNVFVMKFPIGNLDFTYNPIDILPK